MGIFQHYFLFEQFFSLTDQNRTIGYTKETSTDIITPIFEDEIIGEDQVKIAKMHYNIVENFTVLFIQTKLYLFVNLLYHNFILQVICQFGLNPSKKYLEALVGFNSTNNKYSYKNYIKKFSLHEWFYVFLFSRKIETFGFWYKGSLYYNINTYLGDLYFTTYRIVRKIKRFIKL